MKYLAIDYGKKYLGLAIADKNKVAMPLEIIQNKSEDFVIHELLKIIKEYKIDILVLGAPYWHSNEQLQVVLDFKNKLAENLEKENLNIEIVLVDEALTSKAVESLPFLAKKKQRIDDLSAMLILESYLESQND